MTVYRRLQVFQSTPSPRRETTDSQILSFSSILFQSTPSPRRETQGISATASDITISIHSLPKEGDDGFDRYLDRINISIHSLPKEGDNRYQKSNGYMGGFQSTPSPRRETTVIFSRSIRPRISIHSLPKEGDVIILILLSVEQRFQSTPSPRRETSISGVDLMYISFQSTPSPRRETTPFQFKSTPFIHFNPLPPQGGRL